MSGWAPSHQLTREDRAKGGRAAVAKRSEAAMEQRRRVFELVELADSLEGEGVSAAMLGALAVVAGHAFHGDLPLASTPLEVLRYMEAARIAHTIYRLETGQSTANTASISVGDDALRARLAELTGRLADTPPDAPSTSADTSRRDTNAPESAPHADVPTDTAPTDTTTTLTAPPDPAS